MKKERDLKDEELERDMTYENKRRKKASYEVMDERREFSEITRNEQERCEKRKAGERG